MIKTATKMLLSRHENLNTNESFLFSNFNKISTIQKKDKRYFKTITLQPTQIQQKSTTKTVTLTKQQPSSSHQKIDNLLMKSKRNQIKQQTAIDTAIKQKHTTKTVKATLFQKVIILKYHSKMTEKLFLSFQKTTFYNGECHCSRQQPK